MSFDQATFTMKRPTDNCPTTYRAADSFTNASVPMPFKRSTSSAILKHLTTSFYGKRISVPFTHIKNNRPGKAVSHPTSRNTGPLLPTF